MFQPQAKNAMVQSSTQKDVPAVTSVANLSSYLTTQAFTDDEAQKVSLFSRYWTILH